MVERHDMRLVAEAKTTTANASVRITPALRLSLGEGVFMPMHQRKGEATQLLVLAPGGQVMQSLGAAGADLLWGRPERRPDPPIL